jgi:hypothetical protein
MLPLCGPSRSGNPSFPQGVPACLHGTCLTDNFQQFVVFRPDAGTPSSNIYVTLGQASWGWSATSSWSVLGGWSKPAGPPPTRPVYHDSSDPPVWFHTYTNP